MGFRLRRLRNTRRSFHLYQVVVSGLPEGT
jgi:hypothetical protein